MSSSNRQEAGQVVWYSHLSQNFPQFTVIHTVKGFGIVNKVEIDVFLELSYFFDDPVDVGNLVSGSSAFSKTSLNVWKFTVHVLLKPGLENFEHYFTSVRDECSFAIVWVLFGTAFLWNWNENWPFLVLWPLLRLFIKFVNGIRQSRKFPLNYLIYQLSGTLYCHFLTFLKQGLSYNVIHNAGSQPRSSHAVAMRKPSDKIKKMSSSVYHSFKKTKVVP